MVFNTILFALVSATVGLAAVMPRADAVEAAPASGAGYPVIMQAYSQKDWQGDVINVGTEADVLAHPEKDGSTATCFNVQHNFISSVYLADIEGELWHGIRPYGCQLYAEDNCHGDSRWIQSSGILDAAKLRDFNNINFDKRTASVKCWLKASW